MPINPFNPYFPAHDELFANRRKEQALFARALATSTQSTLPGAWNLALVGPWGIGKTSLLRRFAWMSQIHDPPVAVVTLTATTATGTFDGFVRSLLSRIYHDLSAQPRLSERLRSELQQWEPRIHLGPVSLARHPNSSDPGVATGIDLLYTELSRLWKQHVSDRLAAICLFIDDASNLLTVDKNALLSLRAVFQDLQGQKMVYPLIITGPENMFEATRDSSEPVTRFFERLPIGPFTRHDTEEAIMEPLAAVHYPVIIEPSAIDTVYDRTLGHPYFVAFTMRELIDAAALASATRIDGTFVVHQWPIVAERFGEEKFAAEWNQATDSERDVLVAIAHGNTVSQGNRSGATLALRLVNKGLLTKHGRGQYRLYHPLFQEYVLHHYG